MKFRKLHHLLLLVVVLALCVKGRNAVAQVTEKRQKMDHRKKAPSIVFLVTEDPDNYEAHKTVPVFANLLRQKWGYDVTVLLGTGMHGAYSYPNFQAVAAADLLVVFARRIALPHEQIGILRSHLQSGKPLIGIRTANHAFTPREVVQEGYEAWPAFVSDVLGCENRGYGPVEPGTDVSVAAGAAKHPILKGIDTAGWHSKGNLYLVAPLLDHDAQVLLTGKVNDIVQPIAWTRKAGTSKVFYTSLGYPTDFQTPHFTSLLTNAITWSLQKNK